MKHNFDEMYDNDTMYADQKFKIIELVFRIKNMSANYVISNELNYLRLIK